MSGLNDLPLLSMLIVTLPLGAALIWVTPRPGAARWIALATMLVDLVLSLLLVFSYDPSHGGFQFVEKHAWVTSLNIEYHMGIDGISVLFLPMTVLLVIAVIVAGWRSIHNMPRLYYTLLLLLESTTLGVFCALDTVLFYTFWELTLIPLYFLISLYGLGPHRRFAAVQYTMFMLAGGVALLFAFLILSFNAAPAVGGVSFDYTLLTQTAADPDTQRLVFFLLLLGFAVKIPVFPLHTWLPTLCMQGPIAVSALITGLKLGAYGLIRFAIPLAPQAAQEYHWLLAGLGVLGLLYGALAALVQSNLRRVLAYASMSHVGLVVLGISALNEQGLQGAVFQLLNFTVVAGGLFILTGFMHYRLGSTDFKHLGGAAQPAPVLGAMFFVLAIASLGVPGTSGFPAELLLIFSALDTHTGAGLAALAAVVLSAAYTLRAYRLSFYGPVRDDVLARMRDLNARERLVAVMLLLWVAAAGLNPGWVFAYSERSAALWAAALS